MFQLYNFLSTVVADNDSFYEPERRLQVVKVSVAQGGYPSLPKQKHEETKNDKSNGSHNMSLPYCLKARSRLGERFDYR